MSNKPYNDDYKRSGRDDEYLEIDDDYEYENSRVYEDDHVQANRREERDYRDSRGDRSRRDYGDRGERRGRRDTERRSDRSRDMERRGDRDRARDTERRTDREREADRRYYEERKRRDQDPRRDRDPGRDRPPRRYENGPRERYPGRRRKGHGCLIAFLVVVIILAAGVIFAVSVASSLWSKVDSANFDAMDVAVNDDLPESVTESTKNYRTIMVFGVDSRDNTTLQEGTLADSNIIVSINKKTGEIKMLSIYRDTYVETTDGEHMKLTEVYSKYGAKEQLQTINKNFDLNVKEYVTVNWKTVADTINELGGIDVELSEAEAEGINKYIDEVIESTGVDSEDVKEKDGTQHLDGVQAVTYCRLRKGLGDDYKRTERQRTVISLTLAKAKEAGILKSLKVCSTVFPGISSSLSLTDLMMLATGMGKFNISDSEGFPFESTSQDGGRYYLYPVTLASNAEELHEFLYDNTDYEPSDTVENLSKEVSSAGG